MQAAQLTGRQVLVEGNTITLAAGGEGIGGFQLNVPANVTVEIRDANGMPVRELRLGNQNDGIQRFSWDGRTNSGAQAAPGDYTFTVKAVSGGKEVDATAHAARRVEGVRQDGNTVQLVLTGAGPVAYSAVKQIL
jgi:flagellar basal-body rod modification protein FlgD